MVKIIRLQTRYGPEDVCGKCNLNRLLLTDAIDVNDGKRNTYVCKCGNLNYK